MYCLFCKILNPHSSTLGLCGTEKNKTIVFARDENGVYNPNIEIEEVQNKVSNSYIVKLNNLFHFILFTYTFEDLM